MVKVRVFSAGNIGKLYLSPYVNTAINGSQVVFSASPDGEMLMLTVAGSPEELLRRLSDGMQPAELIGYLAAELKTSEQDARSILQLMLIRKYVE